jgi:dTDP-4-dehydrorhamnose reductase
VHPLGVYGASKLAGERRVIEVLGERFLILRTAWVYAATGRNFVRTMLRLMAERDRIQVVADQVGAPTWATSVAEALWGAVQKPEFTGIHHWTDAGVASWYDFAVAIAEEGHGIGLLPRAVEVESIATADYPTPARRPAYSVLDRSSAERALGFKPAHWRANLRKMLKELKDA